jgi:hypothetical protein
MGAQEAKLDEAKQLIAEKDYNQALLTLIEVQRENPDLKDETSALIEKILAIKKQYNDKYQILISVLYSEKDVAKGLEIIKELEELDPNSATGPLITQAKKGAEYVTNATHFSEVMDEAYAQLAQKKYSDAMATYLGLLGQPETIGFDLHRLDFQAAGYGEIVLNGVLDTVKRIQDTAGNAKKTEKSLTDAVSAALSRINVVAANEDSVTGFEASLTQIRAAADVEAALRGYAAVLESTGYGIQAQTPDRKDLFLQYLTQLLRGRKDKDEGIILATRLMWTDSTSEITAKAESALTSSMDTAKAFFEKGDSAQAESAFAAVPYRAAMAVKAIGVELAALRPGAGWSFTLQEGQELRDLLGRVFAAREAADESRGYIAMLADRTELSGLPTGENVSSSLLTIFRARLDSLAKGAAGARQEWISRRDDFSEKSRLINSLGRLALAAGDMADRFQSLISELQQKDIGYANRIAQGQSVEFPTRLAGAIAQRALAESALSGVPTEGGKPIGPHPSEALKILQGENDAIKALSGDITVFKSSWKGDKPYVAADSGIDALIASAEDVLKGAAAEMEALTAAARRAQDQHDKAAELVKSGAAGYDQAVKLSASDPERAKNFITDASDAFGKSLTFEEDPAIRARVEAGGDIEKLSNQIYTTLKQRDVTEVEGLISQGAKLFNSGQYADANQKFTQADNRWKERHPGEMYSRDLDYWLTLSKTAQAMSGNRELSPTDASYDVVSSYLNLANQDFLNAQRLMNQGKKDEAQPYLDSAIRNLQSVLSLFPENRISRVLELKITELKDPKAFRAKLLALRDLNIQGERNGSIPTQEAYLALLDIREFIPMDPILTQNILEIEYELKIKERPLSATKIRESDQFYVQAQRLYNRNETVTYQPALDALDKALEINRNNEKARALRAIIKAQQGQPVEVLKASAYAEYLRAKGLAESGQVSDAFRIVDQLMKDPANTNFPPLVELNSKLRRMLQL